ncbi:MAG TPA: ATP-dependent Clp protease adapter ClpS [Gammaproteobacteria bacterium]|nr:ATP-dependent Clp protease adapter ClpS [Gammaproteobacteria bacterium]
MGTYTDNQSQHGDVSTETSRPKLKRPPMYKVIILNDDYTPMDFVVMILERFFAMNREKATQIMLQVHTRGAGVCGIFSRDIAETKVAQVENYSQQHNHPLKCTMEVA